MAGKAYYRVTGRGGFKWGRHMFPGRIVEMREGEKVPAYFEPATELDFVNQERIRRGEKILQALPPRREKAQPEVVVQEEKPSGSVDRESQLRQACALLKRPEDWTESGRPRVSMVNDILEGWGVDQTSAGEIQSVIPDVKRPGASGGVE